MGGELGIYAYAKASEFVSHKHFTGGVRRFEQR